MPLLLNEIITHLENQFPLSLAEDWDNVGLLAGNRSATINRVMTCLTITPESCQEAIDEHADLIITHHPFPFHAVNRITSGTNDGDMLWHLIRNGIAIYSPHTAFDSAANGINQRIANLLELSQVTTLYPSSSNENGMQGTGRIGMLPQPIPFIQLVKKTATLFGVNVVPYVVPDNLKNASEKFTTELDKSVTESNEFLTKRGEQHFVQTIAIGCGAAGEFLEQAVNQSADVFLTGEVKFHTMLAARAYGVALIFPGHYATERFALEQLADELQSHFADSLTVWASCREAEPLRYWSEF